MTNPGASEPQKRSTADRRELERAKRLALKAIEIARQALARDDVPARIIAEVAHRAARETGRLWDAASRLTT